MTLQRSSTVFSYDEHILFNYTIYFVHLLQFFELAREIWEETRDKTINFILVCPMDNSFHESTGKEKTYPKISYSVN